MKKTLPTTLGELKKSGYEPRSIRDEIRANLICKLRKKENIFHGILGFEDTVLPDIERALLSRHSILLLGLRGQAKTRIARLFIELLDEYIPVVEGSELNDDPLVPISRFAKDLIMEKGDNTPVAWVHRSERYVEKLATPDVSVADLIGDVDPIKAATKKLSYADERVIHFGLVPRSHRSIFVINELPDLQARIQVALFNILEEGDIQIRGFKMRLPLDIQFVFTANPEDYTNRGSIITPLKDRIESQILTHYPNSLEIAKAITEQEARIPEEQKEQIQIPEAIKDILELISFEARESEFVDENSGVSARISIAGLENLFSTIERRMIMNGEKGATARISDFWGVIPAVTGKLELVYEGEQEGPYQVALSLLGQAIKNVFLSTFPHPDKGESANDVYGAIRAYFSDNHSLDLDNDSTEHDYREALNEVPGLEKLLVAYKVPVKDKYVYKELILHALAEFDVLSKDLLLAGFKFTDPLADILDDLDEE